MLSSNSGQTYYEKDVLVLWINDSTKNDIRYQFEALHFALTHTKHAIFIIGSISMFQVCVHVTFVISHSLPLPPILPQLGFVGFFLCISISISTYWFLSRSFVSIKLAQWKLEEFLWLCTALRKCLQSGWSVCRRKSVLPISKVNRLHIECFHAFLNCWNFAQKQSQQSRKRTTHKIKTNKIKKDKIFFKHEKNNNRN